VTAEPSFVLSGPAGTVVAEGINTGFSDIDAAAAALRDGSAPVVVGALPFDLSESAALLAPVSIIFDRQLPWAGGNLPTVLIDAIQPEAAEHRARIMQVLTALRAANASLRKVVLARRLRLVADGAIDPMVVIGRLAVADPEGSTYLADLSPAGGEYMGTALVGASPELLVARSGEQVICRPFAGSAARSADPDIDADNAAALADSAKDRHEHQLVVDTMRTALAPLCSELEIAPRPQLSRTAALWHLSTPIRGTLRESSTTALDLAIALHPTPAVGGVPTDAALQVIAQLEGSRGFYAGAVGWCNTHGDGRWVVAIRGAQLSADRRTALAQAGGGIVAESDPDAEIEETTTKFRTILAGLGVQP
jgi:isochorismate synthase